MSIGKATTHHPVLACQCESTLRVSALAPAERTGEVAQCCRPCFVQSLQQKGTTGKVRLAKVLVLWVTNHLPQVRANWQTISLLGVSIHVGLREPVGEENDHGES